MKKTIFTLACLLTLAIPAHSSIVSSSYVEVDNEDSLTMDTMWTRTGKYEEKVINVGSKLLYANGINKRVPFVVARNTTINAYSNKRDKVVTIHKGLFPYIDSDDELAFILGHEISHSLDAYGELPAWIANTFNSKHYEYRSDLMAIDMMKRAGYNPIAAITCCNKWMGESQYDFGLFTSHPKTSKRMLAMYKYISVKYPSALNSDAASSIYFVNFKQVMDRDIREFEQKRLEKERKKLQKEKEKNENL